MISDRIDSQSAEFKAERCICLLVWLLADRVSLSIGVIVDTVVAFRL